MSQIHISVWTVFRQRDKHWQKEPNQVRMNSKFLSVSFQSFSEPSNKGLVSVAWVQIAPYWRWNYPKRQKTGVFRFAPCNSRVWSCYWHMQAAEQYLTMFLIPAFGFTPLATSYNIMIHLYWQAQETKLSLALIFAFLQNLKNTRGT